jgi:hypothetical protein
MSVPVAAVAVALLAFVFRLAAFNGFENDHFMHVAWGQQLLFGDWPGRDFAEPGMPLAVSLSALAQRAWPGFLSEAVLGITMVSVAAGFACAAAASALRSIPVGMVVGLVVAASYTRLYSYPKLLVPAVALWLVTGYARQPSMRRLAAMAAWSVVAFLLRHDLGVVAALAFALAIATDASRGLAARAGAVGRLIALGLAFVAPYLVYVQLTEGVAEHVRVGLEFGKAEQHQVLWGLPTLVPEEGGLQLRIGSGAVSPEAVLFWIYSGVAVGLTALLVAWRTRPATTPFLVALWVFVVAFRVVILRHPLRARLPDVAVVAALSGVIVAWALDSRIRAWWRTRPVWSTAIAAAGGAVVGLAAASLWSVVNLSDRLDQAGLTRGVRGVWRSARGIVEKGAAKSWEPYWPAGYAPPIVDYLARCTRPSDRLLLTFFAPEYYLFAGRPFAAGQSQFFRESFATERDQAVMLERIRAQTVPFVLIDDAEQAQFARAFPRLASYLSENYTVRARFPRDDEGATIAIAVRNDLHPRTSFGEPLWPCGYD